MYDSIILVLTVGMFSYCLASTSEIPASEEHEREADTEREPDGRVSEDLVESTHASVRKDEARKYFSAGSSMTNAILFCAAMALVVSVGFSSAAWAAGRASDPERARIFKEVQELIKTKDVYAATEFVTRLGEKKAAAAFSNLLFDLHYKAKSTGQVVAFGKAGIQHCLTVAARLKGKDKKTADAFRLQAKCLATNLASFTWPGWGKGAPPISEEQAREGLQAARCAVRLAHELKLDAGKLSFTCWYLGAHLMAQGKYDEAVGVFEKSKTLGEKKKDPAATRMTEGYIGLTKVLGGKKSEGEKLFKSSLYALKTIGNEDAKFYAKQLLDVRKVFDKK